MALWKEINMDVWSVIREYKIRLLVPLLFLGFNYGQVYAATATWTGLSELVTTVTYQQAFKCQYQFAGQKFWRLFRNYCPPTVEVE